MANQEPIKTTSEPEELASAREELAPASPGPPASPASPAAPASPAGPDGAGPGGRPPGTPGSPLRAEQRQAAAEGGPSGRGPLSWFRRLSRPGRLAVTGSAAVLAVVAALLALGATSAGPGKAVVSHPRAPAFSLAVLGHPGQQISLAQYAGRPLIINFFASWCTPCQRETPLIAGYHRSHPGVTILGVDVNDSSSAALAFVHKTGVSYPVVADPAPMAMTLSYGVVALPQTFFLDAQHRIVKRVIRAVTRTDLNTGVALMTSQSKRS
jgi:cytochrome c biogenesis protein CcmG, thiol:disulfide interchange protein DsbE